VTATLVDSHAHLQHKMYDSDQAAVIERAVAAGLAWILDVGNDVAAARVTVAFAQANPGIRAAVGIHPHYANQWSKDTEQELAALLTQKQVVALGEVGLDYHYEYSPREQQLTAFAAQLELAVALAMPVLIHARAADADVLRMLQAVPGLRGVWHCFWSDAATAAAALDLGFYIGVGGPVTFKNDGGLRSALAQVPLERILLETDAPYLAPSPVRGRRNEPAYVAHIAAALAESRGCSVDEVGAITTANAENLFGRPDNYLPGKG